LTAFICSFGYSGERLSTIVATCLYTLFHCLLSTALVLFAAAEKEGKLHTSSPDITASYVLLVGGALVLDVTSSIFSALSFRSFHSPYGKIGSAAMHVASCIQPAWSRKQWSEQLAQYNMIKRHAMGDISACKLLLRKLMGKPLFGDWGTQLFDTTYTPITRDHTLIKGFILDSLLSAGKRNE
jgi:hypothetical protein